MDLLDDAAWRLVHEFPGGAVKLAPLVNMNAGTLNNKADPGQPAQMSVREAVAIQRLRGTRTMLEAEAALLDCMVVPLGDYPATSDLELLDLVLELSKEHGETSTAIRKAIADGRIDRDDYAEVEREFMDDIRASMTLLGRLRGMQVGE